ncbi:MAG TPA: tetratricopeptide repeat protein [Planctomycetota bacterium]|jgi:tetratricopeptide (TPR) repeat protein|nr:tetratricopeptide repeat protein [Planctomycetota bacterium]
MRLPLLLAAAVAPLFAPLQSPEEFAPQVAGGRARLERDDPAGALTVFLAILQRRPEHVPALQGASTSFLALGRFEEALALLERLARLRPQQPEVFHHRGYALYSLGRMSEAEADLRKSLQLRSDLAAASVVLGKLLRASRRAGEAVEVLRKGREASPSHAGILAELGDALAESGEDAGAEEALRESLRLDPAIADARFRLGIVFQRTGRGAEALAEWEKVVEQRPAHRGAWYQIARARSGDPGRSREAVERFRTLSALEEKREHLEKRLRGNPEGGALRLEVAEVLLALEEPRAALGHLLLVGNDPSFADRALGLCGRAYLETSSFDEAARAFEGARSLAPDRPEHRLGLARAHRGAGRADAARAEVEGVLAGDPGNAEAAALLGELRRAPPAATGKGGR